MKSIIENSLSQSHSYVDYRNYINDILKEGKSTGKEQSEALTHYSELNEARMNRLEKTVKISTEIIQKLNQLNGDYIWLVISEGWCGDAAQIVPYLFKIAALNPLINVLVQLRDSHSEIESYLSYGKMSIPKLIVRNKQGIDLFIWGPRPQKLEAIYLELKNKNENIDDMKTILQKWYNDDKGKEIQEEIMELIKDR